MKKRTLFMLAIGISMACSSFFYGCQKEEVERKDEMTVEGQKVVPTGEETEDILKGMTTLFDRSDIFTINYNAKALHTRGAATATSREKAIEDLVSQFMEFTKNRSDATKGEFISFWVEDDKENGKVAIYQAALMQPEKMSEFSREVLKGVLGEEMESFAAPSPRTRQLAYLVRCNKWPKQLRDGQLVDLTDKARLSRMIKDCLDKGGCAKVCRVNILSKNIK